MNDDIPGGPLDSRAIGDLEIITAQQAQDDGLTWIKVTAWCPLCWWRYGPEEFHERASAAGVRDRMRRQHRKEKPNCHETIRIEGK